MLQISNLTYILEGLPLINNLNLSTNNWIFFVFGPSGSGKTTLFKLIFWLLKPTLWEIKTSKNIWIFWQNYNLLPLDGKTNLNLPFYFHKLKKDKKREDKLIDYFEVNNILSKNTENMSNWEKEKIWILKAFITKPNLVLLDETWNSLHQDLKIKLINFVKKYSKENTVLWISHDYFITSNLKSEDIIYKWNFNIYRTKC